MATVSQKRSAGRWSKGNGETIHNELKERFALNKSKQRSLFPQPPRRLPSVPRLSWLTTIVHSSLKSIREHSLCSRYYAWCRVCRWQDRGTVLLRCAITRRRQTKKHRGRALGCWEGGVQRLSAALPVKEEALGSPPPCPRRGSGEVTSHPLATAKPPPRRSTIPQGTFSWATFQFSSGGG